MKNSIYIFLGSLVLLISSCNNIVTYNDGYAATLVNNGPAVITSVSAINNRDSIITSATIQQYVIIQGDNFIGTSKLTYNNMPIDIKQVYITKKEITFQIPETVPDTLNNKIILTTPTGVITTNLNLVLPKLVIKGMESEYVVAGDSLMITGKYFNIWAKKVMFDDIQANFTIRNKDTLMIAVPDAKKTVMSKVSIIDKNDSTRLVPYYYRDSRNSPATFESPYIGAANTAGYIVSNGTNPLPISGNYSMVTGVSDGSWLWYYCGDQNYTLPDDVILNPGKYYIKWEYLTLNDYPNNAVAFYINTAYSGAAAGIFGNFKGSPKWKTYSVSLDKIIKTPLATTVNQQYRVRFILASSYNDGGKPFKMCIDNIRIVPKEN